MFNAHFPLPTSVPSSSVKPLQARTEFVSFERNFKDFSNLEKCQKLSSFFTVKTVQAANFDALKWEVEKRKFVSKLQNSGRELHKIFTFPLKLAFYKLRGSFCKPTNNTKFGI